jgi:sulfur-oxidizing protein SoxA
MRAWVALSAALAVCLHCSTAEATDKPNAPDTRVSGYSVMSRATQGLQDNDAENPAFLWVKGGEAEWQKKPSADKKTCADCHGALSTFAGVAARYPAYRAELSRVLNLPAQIDHCRVTRQGEPPRGPEHETLLNLVTAIAHQSRGKPIAPPEHAALTAARARGEKIFTTRMGQVDLSCRDCHDALAGKRLGGNVIPQGHPTGYPIYRLEWQRVGSLQRRLRNCITAVRADVSSFNAEDFIDIEAYLMKRATGMKMESPGVRP